MAANIDEVCMVWLADTTFETSIRQVLELRQRVRHEEHQREEMERMQEKCHCSKAVSS